jgi:hypothetical protein
MVRNHAPPMATFAIHNDANLEVIDENMAITGTMASL